ncbi:MAG: hypothetical protein WDZ26_06585 [Nitriliruptoraceae bacterium]
MTRTTERHTHRSLRTVAGLLGGVLAAVALAACASEADASADHQADVAERGSQVMPFDLDATTHRFASTETGLVQTITAHDPDDGEQIALIREHLEEEAARFAQGDLDDPATIHGDDMPGLADLRSGATDIDIEFETRDDGARLTYTTEDPELVEALHQWGAAQVSDHGDHAEQAS